MINIKEKGLIIKKYYGVALMLLFFGGVHLFASPTYWDDLGFRNMVHEENFSFLTVLISRYQSWSSRTVIEAVLFGVARLPVCAWKIADFFVVLLLYCDIVWLLNLKTSEDKNFAAFILMAFPFSIFASTGWMATTMNYLWVIAFGLYVLVGIGRELRLIPQSRHKPYCYFAYILCLIYSANFEFMGCILVVCFVLAWGYSVHKSIKSVFVRFGGSLAIISVFYIILCPGNKLRPEVDIKMWSPDFMKMSILDKVRIGIVATYSHFACVPSALFGAFLLLIFICGVSICKNKNQQLKIANIAFAPIVIYAASFIYFAVKYIIPQKTITYVIPSDLIHGVSGVLEQTFIIVAFVVSIGIVWYIFDSLYGRTKTIELFFVLALGFGPCIAMGLTAELRSSLLRVMGFAYISLMLIIVWLFKKEKNFLVKNRLFKNFLHIVIICGDMMNALQVIRHIRVYG